MQSAFQGRIERLARDAMTSASVAVIASGVQGDAGGRVHTSGMETLLLVVAIVAMTIALTFVVRHLRRRSRRPRQIDDEWGALAVMGELCPHGWKAQVTLYGWNAPVPADAPPSRVPLVELEWTQFDEESGRVAVARRVWAPSIGEALQTMIEDRRTDLTLEEIEQSAAEDDELWWED